MARWLGLSGAEDGPVVAAIIWGSQRGQPRPTRVSRAVARRLGLSGAADDLVVGASGWGSQRGQSNPTVVVRVSHF